ncbi:MAG TPA: hypothetical protein VL307_15200 [Chitinophagaceae bacterium]|nr:hypothetical protein [Chitinophagaceae bacterium]
MKRTVDNYYYAASRGGKSKQKAPAAGAGYKHKKAVKPHPLPLIQNPD